MKPAAPKTPGNSQDGNSKDGQTPKPPGRPMAPGDEAPPGTPGTGENLCPRCSGSGRLGPDPCPDCEGTGTVITGVGGA